METDSKQIYLSQNYKRVFKLSWFPYCLPSYDIVPISCRLEFQALNSNITWWPGYVQEHNLMTPVYNHKSIAEY